MPITHHMNRLSIEGYSGENDQRQNELLEIVRKVVNRRICVIQAEAKEREPKLHQYRKWLRGIGYIRDNRYMTLNEGIEQWLNADEPPD